MPNEHRLELTEGELQALVQGDEIMRDGVALILCDMGFDRIQLAMRRGISEAARRTHAGEAVRWLYSEL